MLARPDGDGDILEANHFVQVRRSFVDGPVPRKHHANLVIQPLNCKRQGAGNVSEPTRFDERLHLT